MKKHLFLTGVSGIGKTTIIRQALGSAAGYAGGFITERVADGDGSVEGFDLYPAAAAIGHDGFDGLRFLDLGTVPPQKDNEVFRESAAQMLREAEYYPFVMLDEIGGFEMLIPQFRNELAQLLNSDAPIIGVIKGAENAEELRASFGLGEKFTMLTDNLRAVLANDEDTVVIEVKQRGDETARRIVEAWVKEYADIR
ncbi:MAG: nucleoside-triphosphatase [Candidatus Limivicinus sp.]|nr:nucleoside-triphosphatase [Candidatus Limivicinus sp.]